MPNLDINEKILQSPVLVVSEGSNILDTLKDWGFKNIDCVSSVIYANEYFRKRPEDLEQYGLVIAKRDILTNCGFCNKILSDCSTLAGESNTQPLFLQYNGWFSYDFKSIFNKLIEIGIHSKELLYVPLSEKIRKNEETTIPLPQKLENLKILFLYPQRHKMSKAIEILQETVKNLGIENITIVDDNNYAVQDHVLKHAGEYDIILGTQSYSESILYLINEATKQAKYTGKKLILFGTYDFESIAFGERANIDYVTGGQYGNRGKLKLTVPVVKETSLEILTRIIEAIITEYFKIAISHESEIVIDSRLRTAEDSQIEYNNTEAQIRERIAKEKAISNKISSLQEKSKSYLKAPVLKSAEHSLEISVKKTKPGEIELTLLYSESKILGIITLFNSDSLSPEPYFSIQTVNKKGCLSELKRIRNRFVISSSTAPTLPIDEKQLWLLNLADQRISLLLNEIKNPGHRIGFVKR